LLLLFQPLQLQMAMALEESLNGGGRLILRFDPATLAARPLARVDMNACSAAALAQPWQLRSRHARMVRPCASEEKDGAGPFWRDWGGNGFAAMRRSVTLPTVVQAPPAPARDKQRRIPANGELAACLRPSPLSVRTPLARSGPWIRSLLRRPTCLPLWCATGYERSDSDAVNRSTASA